MAFSHRRIDLQHDSSRTAKAVREPLEGQRARTDLEPLADYRSRQHRFVERILCDLVAVEQDRVRSMQIWHVTVHEIEGVERSEEHTSELQSLMRISSAVFCLKKEKKKKQK